MTTRLLLMASVFLGVFLSLSQIMLAKASRSILLEHTISGLIRHPFKLIRVDLMIAVIMYVLATGAYMYLLTKGQVISVYALMLSTALISAYFFAALFFGESIQLRGVFAIFVIILGVWLLLS